MILSIFLTLLLLTILLVAIGLAADKPYLLGVGYVFLFIIGVILAGINNPVIPAGVQYTSGHNTTTMYTYTNSTLTSTLEVEVTNTTTFTNMTLGFFFAIVSIFAFTLLLMQYRSEDR